MSKRPADLFVEDIRESVARIERYTAGLDLAGFKADQKIVDAVVRNLEIIGEAARRFDDAFRLAHGEIPWRAMTDVRNILIHAYDQVAAEILVDIVRQDIPPLLAAMKGILGEDKV